jgi:hypothetical protein
MCRFKFVIHATQNNSLCYFDFLRWSDVRIGDEYKTQTFEYYVPNIKNRFLYHAHEYYPYCTSCLFLTVYKTNLCDIFEGL